MPGLVAITSALGGIEIAESDHVSQPRFMFFLPFGANNVRPVRLVDDPDNVDTETFNPYPTFVLEPGVDSQKQTLFCYGGCTYTFRVSRLSGFI